MLIVLGRILRLLLSTRRLQHRDVLQTQHHPASTEYIRQYLLRESRSFALELCLAEGSLSVVHD